jgi:hypothetical protein
MQRKSLQALTRSVFHVVIAAAAVSFTAGAAHADSTAARKLGQIGLINQTLQPKPPKPSPSYEPNNSSTYNANDAANANARSATNAGNPANPNPPAGAYPLTPNTK